MNFSQNKFLILSLVLAAGLFSFHFAYAGDALKVIGAVILAVVAVATFNPALFVQAATMVGATAAGVGAVNAVVIFGSTMLAIPIGIVGAAVGATLICAGGVTSGTGVCAGMSPTVVVSGPAVPGQTCAGAIPVVFYNVNPNTEKINCVNVVTNDSLSNATDTMVDIYRFAVSPVPGDPTNFVFDTPKLNSGSGILNINGTNDITTAAGALIGATMPSSNQYDSTQDKYWPISGLVVSDTKPFLSLKYKDFCFTDPKDGSIKCSMIDQTAPTSSMLAYVAKIKRPYRLDQLSCPSGFSYDTNTLTCTDPTGMQADVAPSCQVGNVSDKFLSANSAAAPYWPYITMVCTGTDGWGKCTGYRADPIGVSPASMVSFRQTPTEWTCPLSTVSVTTTTCTSTTLNIKISNPAGTTYQVYRVLQKDYQPPTVADPGNPAAGIPATVASPGNIGTLIATNPTSQTSFTDTNLVPHTKYVYTVKVLVNNSQGGGTKEETSNAASYTICPPQGCTFSANPTTVLNFPADAKLSWKCASGADSCKIDSNATGAAANAPTNFTPDFSVGGIFGQGIFGQGAITKSVKQWVGGALSNLPISGGVGVKPDKATDYVLTCSNPDGQVQYKASVSLKKPGIQEVKPQ